MNLIGIDVDSRNLVCRIRRDGKDHPEKIFTNDAAGFGAVGLPIPEYTGLRGVGLQVQTILLHNGQLMVAPRLGILLGD